MVNPVILYGREIWTVTDGYGKAEYVGETNLREDMKNSSRTRNMECKN